jgi:NAD(P)H dehydrogenase (quinone)
MISESGWYRIHEAAMIITVTGSSGTIGGELVRLLSAAGAPTRAVLRNAKKSQPLPAVAWLQADLADDAPREAALAGTARLFLLTDNQPGFGALQTKILQSAASLGVAHVVKVSALGASDHSKSWIAREHRQVEDALERSSMSWTILRPHAFMQNWLGDVAESVRTRGVIESPIDDARVPFIDTRDIAAAAAELLLHPEAHAGRKYVLTGGEAVGFRDLASALTAAAGREVI